MVTIHPPNACRICSGSDLLPILSFGQTPLANALVPADRANQVEPTYPLNLALCRQCALVQILETVPAAELFSQYPYFSSYSDSLLTHAEALAERFWHERGLGLRSLVLEVGSNDGYLLKHFAERGVPVLGIEPAENIAAVAQAEGIETIREFFGAELAGRLRADGIRPDLICANNVLAHAEYLNDFVSGLALLLHGEATAEIEVPYIRDLIEQCEFDTIYHEHRCYFSLTSLSRLFARHGLAIVKVERIPLHGGSLHVSVAPKGARPPDPSVATMLAEEHEWGIAAPQRYRAFADRVASLRVELVDQLDRLRNSGKRIVAYGAAAKGVMLLSYCGIGREHLDYVVDRSPHKQGRLLPGTRLPILEPEQLLTDQPDYVLLLAWNFADEIINQQAEYTRRGGRFIIPIPEVRVV